MPGEEGLPVVKCLYSQRYTQMNRVDRRRKMRRTDGQSRTNGTYLEIVGTETAEIVCEVSLEAACNVCSADVFTGPTTLVLLI